MAKQAKWSQEEIDFLEDNYKVMGSKGLEKFQKKLFKVSGVMRSRSGIRQKANDLGIKARDHYGMPTVGECAKEWGVHKEAVLSFIREHPEEYPVKKNGHHYILPAETYEKLDKQYRIDPEVVDKTVTTQEAAEVLMTVKNNINLWCKYGIIDFVIYRGNARVYKESIEHMLFLRKKHGGGRWLKAAVLAGDIVPNEKYYEANRIGAERLRQKRSKQASTVLTMVPLMQEAPIAFTQSH